VLSNEQILLKRLKQREAKEFYALYMPEDKTPMEFTLHILSICNDIFTIRTRDNPLEIIGDCALHHWDREKSEMEIGGMLLPEYWGIGIMASAFQLLTDFAKQEYKVEKLVVRTEMTNSRALKFAEKMGFCEKGIIGNTVLMEKTLIQ